MKIIKVLFIYFFIITYSVETLLFLFSSNEQKSLIDIKNTRISLAKKNNKKYDIRSPEEAFFDFKKINNDIKPFFYYNSTFSVFKTFKEALLKNSIIPFRGPINNRSVSCAEDLNYTLINNDKFGFKNTNSIYKQKINTAILGDSYAEGLCVNNSNDIAGNLIQKKINTINLGVTGSGPLTTLAILREYGNFFKPKNSIYLYFEGNDLDDLNWEKKNDQLLKYLNNSYKLDYINNYKYIEIFLKEAEKESIKIARLRLSTGNYDKAIQKKKINLIKEHLKDIIELNHLKNIIKFNILNNQNIQYDLNFLYDVVERMNIETKNWNGDFIFVYVPTWSRYFTSHSKEVPKQKLKDEILKNIELKGIKTIDLTDFFDSTENIKQFFPLGYLGHFNSNGYKKIAEIVIKELDIN